MKMNSPPLIPITQITDCRLLPLQLSLVVLTMMAALIIAGPGAGLCDAAPANGDKAHSTTLIASATRFQTESDLETAPQVTDTPARRPGINFLTLLTRGGWFMLPLLLLSILVVAIGVERFLALRRERIFPPELVDQISMLSAQKGGLDPRRVYQLCQTNPSSATYVLRTMLMKVGRPQAEMENAVSEAAQREATRLSRMTSWLTLAAAIAPLIGLLGTVWGITQAFYDTTQLVVGQNRAEALAQGIYTALVTTMTGLLIAIPAAVLSHYYENRIVQLINEIEEMAYHLLPQLEKYEGQVRFTVSGLQPREGASEPTPASSYPVQAGAAGGAPPHDSNGPPENSNGGPGSLAVPPPEKFFKP